jgi:hypothetical protein
MRRMYECTLTCSSSEVLKRTAHNLSCACDRVRMRVHVFVRLKYNLQLSHFETSCVSDQIQL